MNVFRISRRWSVCLHDSRGGRTQKQSSKNSSKERTVFTKERSHWNMVDGANILIDIFGMNDLYDSISQTLATHFWVPKMRLSVQ